METSANLYLGYATEDLFGEDSLAFGTAFIDDRDPSLELKQTNHWWLDDSFVQYAHLQTEARREADVWSELVQKHINSDETSITEAFEHCFPRDDDAPPLDPKTISQQDQRRMGTALITAGFERNGKLTSGTRRNQTRFTRAHEVDFDCGF